MAGRRATHGGEPCSGIVSNLHSDTDISMVAEKTRHRARSTLSCRENNSSNNTPVSTAVSRQNRSARAVVGYGQPGWIDSFPPTSSGAKFSINVISKSTTVGLTRQQSRISCFRDEMGRKALFTTVSQES